MATLRQFQLNGVSDTGRIIGNGSYATVKELEFRGLKCVGKKIHQLLFDSATPQDRAAMLQRFTEECELLSYLHHPCVVQFLGIYFEHGSQQPVLVMEYLHTTLSACLNRYGVLPETISYGILRDVVLGLRYLHEHSPPIIHRDLSANNVLLTSSMNAKISDLGVAKILNITPAQMTQRMSTQAPGTPCYMPPEALLAKPTYTSKIDSYSYGVMMIHVLCGRWPFPADAFRPDPQNPDGLVPVSEIDRRADYLQDISPTYPLMGLIRQCLSNFPNRRPEASEILRQITDVMSRASLTHQSKMEMQTRINSMEARINSMEGQLKQRNTRVKQLSTENKQLSTENQEKQSQIESLVAQKQSEVDALRAEVERLSVQNLPKKEKEGNSSQTPAIRQWQPPSIPQRQSHLPIDSKSLRLHPHSRLRWRRVADLPIAMSEHHIVRIGSTIYCGGGFTGKIDTERLVFQYNLKQDTWSQLPICPTLQFGLTQLDGKLVTVGGRTIGQIIPINAVYVFQESETWENSIIPPLPTVCMYPTAVNYRSTLVVSGGLTHWHTNYQLSTYTNAVEVFQTKTYQWHHAEPLPVAHSRISCAVVDGTFYIIGGAKSNGYASRQAYCTSVSNLISRALPPDYPETSSTPQSSPSPPTWQVLPECPLYCSTAAELGGCLLAIGGLDDSNSSSSAVHMYSPSTNSWVRISRGDLPVPRYYAAATQLEGGEVIFVGGKIKQGSSTKTVYIGTV